MQNIENPKLKDLLEFPCDFMFKVLGVKRSDLVDDVIKVVQNNAVFDPKILQNESKNGNYLSVSITIKAKNIDQIETLYSQLAQINGVKMVL